MTSSNKAVVPSAREALDKFKMEAASEVGVNLKQGYNGDLTSREAGSVGGQMVKKMIESYEKDPERNKSTGASHICFPNRFISFFISKSKTPLVLITPNSRFRPNKVINKETLYPERISSLLYWFVIYPRITADIIASIPTFIFLKNPTPITTNKITNAIMPRFILTPHLSVKNSICRPSSFPP